MKIQRKRCFTCASSILLLVKVKTFFGKKLASRSLFWYFLFNLTFLGTLYCAKGNYEFGISRVIKSLEPFNKKLGTDTWFYAKRCFLSLIENLSKHMISVRDSVIQVEINYFV